MSDDLDSEAEDDEDEKCNEDEKNNFGNGSAVPGLLYGMKPRGFIQRRDILN